MSEYLFDGKLRSPDELMAIATYRAKEIERLNLIISNQITGQERLQARVDELEAALRYIQTDSDEIIIVAAQTISKYASQALANSEGENNELWFTDDAGNDFPVATGVARRDD